MSDAYDFFSTTEVSARLDLVRHLIENSELVPLVRGPSGIGKTLLASKIQHLAPESWSVCHFEADPAMQPERLLATIARCCGLPDIAGELLQRLVDRFEVLRKRGRIPVLLVDDAQMLPPTSLITLLRLFERQLDGVRLVSIVLFADEQIDLLLSTPQLQIMSPQAIQVIDMPTMTRQEASAYMFFLIKSEGLSEKLALDEVKLNRLYRETGGNPGELATAILSAVGEGGDKRRDGFGLGGYRKQLLIGGIPLLLIIIILFSVGPISSLFGPEVDSRPDEYADKEIAPLPVPAATAISQPEPLTESARIETPAPMQVDVTAGETGEVQRGSIVEEQPLLAQEADQVTMSTDVPESIGKGEAASGSAGKPDGPGSVETGDEPVKATDSADASAGISVEAVTGGVQNAVAEAVEPVADERQLEQPDVTAEAGPGEIKAPPTEDLPIPDRVETKRVSEARQAGPDEEVAMAESSPAQMVAAGDEEPEWVMSRSPENYTLQLIAVENLDSLKGFVDRHRLHKETHTFEMSRKGKPWYALLWGDFPDRKSAMQAASTLPSAIQKAGVWARTFGSLQKSKAQ